MTDKTPMMAQWTALKSKHKDALLLFRLGDFYELFYEDAEIGSKELGITLTGRGAGKSGRAPMCGVPHKAVDDYIKVLIERGYKVAICDQVEDPAEAKGLVKRDVTRVITPGTYWEGTESSSSGYITSVIFDKQKGAGFAACDLSTGEVLLWDSRLSTQDTSVFDEVTRLLPKECVIPENANAKAVQESLQKLMPGVTMTLSDPEDFSVEDENEGSRHNAEKAFHGLMSYLKRTQMTDLSYLKKPRMYQSDEFVQIDRSTVRNLELLQRLQGGVHGSLFGVLNKCNTAMGQRLLKQWIERPLLDKQAISDRLSVVTEAYNDSAFRQQVRALLPKIRDLERLVTKMSYKSCDARDLVSLASSLENVHELNQTCKKAESELLSKLISNLDHIPEAASAIRNAIVNEPPLGITGGGIIKKGFSAELDELKQLATGGKKWVLSFETKEKERTGIKNLKVGYNRVFGYYIEITKSNLDSVPEEYTRKQTLVSAERFVTPELSDKEASILGAEERLRREEYRIFCEVRDFLTTLLGRIQRTARAVAQIDVLFCLAEVAHTNDYTCPKIADDGTFVIEDGRHPVLETILPPGTYVPNDLNLGNDRVMIITGPNMGGKSTYCRQVALTAIMAQIGSYVPCKSCSITPVDKVFARVGAYDDLVMGQSTFMVEMEEVSRILGSATSKSLVVLDEIGRGTSTFDGLSVAWAVVEHLADPKDVGAMVLVATHYRELTLLSDLKPGVVNYRVSVKRTGDEITLLRHVEPGVSQGSFGIEVSSMAGLPPKVVARAREILGGLETEARRGSRYRHGILGQLAGRSLDAFEAVPGQEALFYDQAAASSNLSAEMVLTELIEKDLDGLTPFQALKFLYELKSKITSRKDT